MRLQIIGALIFCILGFTSALDAANASITACQLYAESIFRLEPNMTPVNILDVPEPDVENFAGQIGDENIANIVWGRVELGKENNKQTSTFVCLLQTPSKALGFFLAPSSVNTTKASDTTDKICADKTGNSAQSRCLDAAAAVADQRLGKIYSAKLTELQSMETSTKRTGAVAALKSSQNIWQNYRQAECALRKEQAGNSKTAVNLQKVCYILKTQARTQELLLQEN